jgi:NitT/TauT family transport system substrate-binding protein
MSVRPDKTFKRQTARILGILFFAAAFFVACKPQTTEQPFDEVAVQLKWVHQAQFAGFYVACEKGYYAQEHITVTLIEGGPYIDLVGQVTAGTADFGVDAPEQLMRAAGQGKAIEAIAAIYRRNPLVFIAMAGSGIQRPQDILGHSIAIKGSDAEIQFQAMMHKLGLDVARVKTMPYEYENTAFYGGQADMTIGYATGSLIRIRQAGYDVNVIWPSDYGIHLYADMLFTTGQLNAENPDLVLRFLRATLRGWREAVGNPDLAVEMTMRYAREADWAMQMEMMAASVPLIHTGEGQIGRMRPEIWQGMYDTLLGQGVLDRALDVHEMYTTTFLDQIYGGES